MSGLSTKTIQTGRTFYKNLFESNNGYAWKQDLNRKMLLKRAISSFFYAFFFCLPPSLHFELRKEDYIKVGESKPRLDYRIVKKLCTLLRVFSIKRHFEDVNLESQKQGTVLA